MRSRDSARRRPRWTEPPAQGSDDPAGVAAGVVTAGSAGAAGATMVPLIPSSEERKDSGERPPRRRTDTLRDSSPQIPALLSVHEHGHRHEVRASKESLDGPASLGATALNRRTQLGHASAELADQLAGIHARGRPVRVGERCPRAVSALESLHGALRAGRPAAPPRPPRGRRRRCGTSSRHPPAPGGADPSPTRAYRRAAPLRSSLAQSSTLARRPLRSPGVRARAGPLHPRRARFGSRCRRSGDRASCRSSTSRCLRPT